MRHADAAVADLGSLSFLLEEGHADRRTLRLGLAAAAVLHGVLFAVTWPAVDLQPPARRPPPVVIRLQPLPRFVEPPPEQVLPRPEVRRVPVPDLTPQDPEPVAREPEGSERLPLPEGLVLGPVEIPAPPVEAPAVLVVGVHIQPPVRIHTVEPRYPEAARRVRQEGAVVLELLIDSDGAVAEATVVRGLPLGLTEAALDAARQWRFEPSRLDGRALPVRYRLTVRFSLAR